MAESVVIADRAIAVLEAGPVDGLPELLRGAWLDGLALQRKTVLAVDVELEEALKAKAEGGGRLEVDIKLLRLGNDAATALGKMGMQAIEGEFQARKLDKLGELIEAIKSGGASSAAGGKPGVEPV